MRTALIALITGIALPLAAPAAPEKPADFASGMVLATPVQAPFYRVELPLGVHAQARSDLGDVRVFNARGEAVPYALPAPPAATAAAPVSQAVPFFPVRGTTATAPDALALDIRQDAGGRLIALRSQQGASNDKVVAYLFDLAVLKRPVQALALDWPASISGYSSEVRLDASDDLRHWQPLTSAPLLDIHHGGQQLAQKRISFSAGHHRYLRLTATGALPPLTAAAVEIPGEDTARPALRWHRVIATAGEEEGHYDFDLGAYLVASRLKVMLPEANTVAPVLLLVRERRQHPWRPVRSATVFRLARESGEAVSPALEITPQSGRYWQLRVDPRAGGLGHGLPVLEVGWVPQTLVFLARGQAPFTLAIGQRDATGLALPLASLLPGYRPGAELALPEATPGVPQALGGRNAPQPGREDAPPPDWKRWLLWAVLLAGTGLMALMAWRLLRQAPPQA